MLSPGAPPPGCQRCNDELAPGRLAGQGGGVTSSLARFPTAFTLSAEHGELHAVHLPQLHAEPASPEVLESWRKLLSPGERALAEPYGWRRLRTFVGGRVALRELLHDDSAEILQTERGAPAVSQSVRASISHKDALAIALCSRWTKGAVGVDLEIDQPLSSDISRHTLTDPEQRALRMLSDEQRAREVRLRFSLKEALYKALDPFVQRYVGFHEVETWPQGSGSARALLALKEREGPFGVELRWMRREGLIVTTARVWEDSGACARC